MAEKKETPSPEPTPRRRRRRRGKRALRGETVRSQQEPKVYVVAYDITAPGRLRAVYKTMRGFGDHLQYSVFRCVLSDTQLERLKTALVDIIDPGEDQVLFVPLGRASSERSWQAFTLGQPLKQPERVVRVL